MDYIKVGVGVIILDNNLEDDSSLDIEEEIEEANEKIEMKAAKAKTAKKLKNIKKDNKVSDDKTKEAMAYLKSEYEKN